MLFNLYFSNGQPPEKVTVANLDDWCYTDTEHTTVTALQPRQSFTNTHGDRWERIR